MTDPSHVIMLTSPDGTALHTQTWLPDNHAPHTALGIIHGWSDHSGRYGNVVEPLIAAGFAVVGLDLRGHGRSSGQRGHINTWADFRQDAQTFVDYLHTTFAGMPVFLMGHSMGGLTVMDYAIHHPQNGLRGLVISSPLLAPPNVPPLLVWLGRILARIYPTFSLNPGADPNTLSRDPAVVQDYLNDPLVHQRATPRLSTEIAATQDFVLANLDGIQQPLVLLYGSADDLVPPHMTRDAFAKITVTDKTRHEYEGGYHELFNDFVQAQAVADLLAWLDERR